MQVFGGDADAGVFHGQADGGGLAAGNSRLAAQAHVYAAAIGRIFHGVRQQVGKQTLNLDAIRGQRAGGGQIGGQADVLLLGGDLELFHKVASHGGEVELGLVQHELPGLGLR